jgi:hypothetical protein
VAYILSLGENSKQAEQQKDGADCVEINETWNNTVIYHTKTREKFQSQIFYFYSIFFFFLIFNYTSNASDYKLTVERTTSE